MYSELFYRIALRKIEGFGPATLKKMLRLSGSAKSLFEQPELWQTKIPRKNKSLPRLMVTDELRRLVDKELVLMDRHDLSLAFILDADYPYRMRSCSDSPISFFYKGSSCFNAVRTLAVVGTRNASEYGRNCVRKILSDLKDTEVVTISGLAYGIDTEAHSRSVEFGLNTIAVMGCGLSTIYPKMNETLARQIIEHGGALVSEFDFRDMPDRMNFPRRNRLIAGMADAVLVVESAAKGGSIITADIAHSYNRDVFAVPGLLFDELHKGCHELIRSNVAALVTSGSELMEMMNWERRSTSVQTSLFVELSDEEEQIVDLIRVGREVSIDQMSEALSGFSPSRLAGVLLGLELKGVVACKPGKRYVLNSP